MVIGGFNVFKYSEIDSNIKSANNQLPRVVRVRHRVREIKQELFSFGLLTNSKCPC